MDAWLEFIEKVPPKAFIVAGAFLRLFLIAVAEVQDYLAEVPYTDVDYQVFTDAAESMAMGMSPYEGRTALLAAEATRYRYTPLLAFILLPNTWLHKVRSYQVRALMIAAHGLQAFLQHKGSSCNLGLALWLFNPFCFTISTRGSGESVVVVLIYVARPFMLVVIYCLEVRQNWFLAAVCYGVAIHWRIYPAVYALPIAIFLVGSGQIQNLLRLVAFGTVSAAVLFGLGLMCYQLYGYEFLECSYLHHGRRRDPQHNFSVYFYPVALYMEGAFQGQVPDVARYAALPQIFLCACFGASTRAGLAVAMLLQTLAFVATNKVLTAQYFVWWLCLIPMALPGLRSHARLLRSLLVWMLAEVHWLLWAYLLEFRKLPVRPVVWMASLIFFAAHLHILREVWRSSQVKVHAS
ncbi:PIGM [Symbiodinium pilosum]|uniref:GPI mannosyltransferase 1 n=1 Tax=Symbiodinium pilosum TaxID=2952 RepID=A0A812S0R7_SYMPI|nr:PIGM [Symbiodinium pilosum]